MRSDPDIRIGDSVFYLEWGVLYTGKHEEGRWVATRGKVGAIHEHPDAPQFLVAGKWRDYVYKENPHEISSLNVRWIKYECHFCEMLQMRRDSMRKKL